MFVRTRPRIATALRVGPLLPILESGNAPKIAYSKLEYEQKAKIKRDGNPEGICRIADQDVHPSRINYSHCGTAFHNRVIRDLRFRPHFKPSIVLGNLTPLCVLQKRGFKLYAYSNGQTSSENTTTENFRLAS